MKYKGVIIEESLINNSIIMELEVLQKEEEKVTERENTPWLDKWTMYTVSIAENQIDDYVEKISKLIDTKHCSDWYCDFKNEKYHYIVFSNKVFKLNIKKKQDYIEMQEYAIKLGLPKEQLPMFNDLPINLLAGFLIYAKKQTYANTTAEKIKSTRLGASDYHFEDILEGEKMIYHDTYFGGSKFIGEEVVYRGSDTPKWGMNYYGNTVDESLSEEAIDKALRPALMKVGEDNSVIPVRGPRRFENGEYVYTFESQGTLEEFSGTERIEKNGKLIYRLCCHGGFIE